MFYRWFFANITIAVSLKTIPSAAPVKLISIDFLHLDSPTGECQYLLVIAHNVSRFAQDYATRNKVAKKATKKLYNDFILCFRLLGSIQHNQGKEFENGLFKSLSKLCNIKRLRTTPSHPQGNGQC